MKNKILIIYVMMFVLCLSSVMSVPPFQEISGVSGYEIRYPQFENIELYQDFNLHIHVFNTSNGFPLDNNYVDFCNLHLYDITGNHILKGNLTYDEDFDFEYYINGSVVFNTTGTKQFHIYCYNNNRGGSVSGIFNVVDSSDVLEDFEEQTADNILFLVFGIFTLILLIYAVTVNRITFNIISFVACLGFGILIYSTSMLFGFIFILLGVVALLRTFIE